MTTESAIPKWFSVVAWVAFVWNLLGLMMFAAHLMMTPEMLAALPENEQALYKDLPVWLTVAFGCATIGGVIGTLLLALRKSISFYPLVISMIGACVQNYHSFFVIDSMAVYGPGSAILPSIVVLITIGLVWLSKDANSKGWTA